MSSKRAESIDHSGLLNQNNNQCVHKVMYRKTKKDKKVLLRDRKRYTAHSVVSTRSVVLSLGGGCPSPGWGVPLSCLGVPQPVLARGYPSPVLTRGYPCPGVPLAETGVPPARTGVSPQARTGVPPWERTWGKKPGTGVPHPLNRHICENITSRRTTYAGGKNDWVQYKTKKLYS